MEVTKVGKAEAHRVAREFHCPVCDGKRHINNPEMEPSGKYIKDQDGNFIEFLQPVGGRHYVTCPECGGTGLINSKFGEFELHKIIVKAKCGCGHSFTNCCEKSGPPNEEYSASIRILDTDYESSHISVLLECPMCKSTHSFVIDNQ